MNPPSLFIATPIARHPVRQYTKSALATAGHLFKLGTDVCFADAPGNANLPQARNELCAAFLASPFEKLLFIDDDMGWHPDDVVRLLMSDKALIAGVGSRKVDLADDDPHKWACRFLPDARFDDAGNLEVEAVGAAFLMICRSVLDTLVAVNAVAKLAGARNMPDEVRERYHRFFKFPLVPDEEGEDYDFCLNWRAFGGEVWIDPAITLTHVGEQEFTGDIRKALVR